LSTFEALGLKEEVLKALPELGFDKPSEIQEKAIPILIDEPENFIGLAQTGTGKTGAFALPLAHHLSADERYIQALVLTPTRELGQQVEAQVVKFTKYTRGINSIAVYGGSSIVQQIKKIKQGVHIIVATPGRLIDLMNRGAVKLDRLKYVVLDEADEMLNMGFKEDLDYILESTPAEKSTWLFSATMPKEIKKIVKNYMKDAVEVSVRNAENVVNKDIEHQYVQVRGTMKTEALKRIMDANPKMRALVFCRTKRDTQNVSDQLKKEGYRVDCLHGDMAQAQRDRVMKSFKSHHTEVVLATDVAARGIDVNDLTHVIHYALPDDRAYYTHRSGRTARAGKKGISMVFAMKSDSRKMQWFERDLKIKFAKVELPTLTQIQAIRIESWADEILLQENDLTEQQLEAVKSARELLVDVKKSELVDKLIAHQLQVLNLTSQVEDLNHSYNDSRDSRSRDRGDRRNRDRDDRRDRSKRSDRDKSRESVGRRRDSDSGEDREKRDRTDRNKSGNRYFINIGRMDGVTPGKLVAFLQETSGVNDKNYSNITITEKCAYFDVDLQFNEGYSKMVNGVKYKGRVVRCNSDSDISNFDNRKSGRYGKSKRKSSGGYSGSQSKSYKGKSKSKSSGGYKKKRY